MRTLPSSGTYHCDVTLDKIMYNVLKELCFISSELLDISGWTFFSAGLCRLFVSNITSVCDCTNI